MELTGEPRALVRGRGEKGERARRAELGRGHGGAARLAHAGEGREKEKGAGLPRWAEGRERERMSPSDFSSFYFLFLFPSSNMHVLK